MSTISSVLETLDNISTASSKLIKSESLEDAVAKVLDMVCVQLDSQVASLFLLSKEGVAERIGIRGVDAGGCPIRKEWLEDENYEPGESFSGYPIPSTSSTFEYGHPNYISENMFENYSDMKYGTDYLEKLGELRCGISVPLNGINGTFGSLEVLNKKSQAAFTCEDLVLLSLIGSNVSGIIRLFVSQEYNKSFQFLVDVLVGLKPNIKGFKLNPICEEIANLTISRFTPYKVCILRVPDENMSLSIKAQAYTSDISWDGRKTDAIPRKHYMIGKVYDTQKIQYIEDVESNIDKFFNKEWIRNQGLKSYACLPLSVSGNCVGTISVYTTFKIKFRKDERDFLEYLAFLVAAIVERVYIMSELKKVRRELTNSQERFLNSSILIGYETQIKDIAHQYKNELIEISLALKEVVREGKSKREKSRLIYDKLDWIEKRKQEVSALITQRETVPVDINELIQQTLRTILIDENIKVDETYINIPIISIEPEKIGSVIHNLVSNATASIAQADRKHGRIHISTDIVTVSDIRKIRISIDDNGAGIPNEVSDRIYDQGFTTKRKTGGTGLGLYISKMIVEEYGGRLYYHSRVGQGTTFYIEIPLQRYRL